MSILVNSGCPRAERPGPLQAPTSRSPDSGHRPRGCPPPWVYEASDGVLVLYNGVTRATRIAKLAPGATIRVEVVGKLRRAYAGEPKIGDHVP